MAITHIISRHMWDYALVSLLFLLVSLSVLQHTSAMKQQSWLVGSSISEPAGQFEAQCHHHSLLDSSGGMFACPCTSALVMAWLRRLPTSHQSGNSADQFLQSHHNSSSGSTFPRYALFASRRIFSHSFQRIRSSCYLGKLCTHQCRTLGIPQSIWSIQYKVVSRAMISTLFP
jgi:hypothetical protein